MMGRINKAVSYVRHKFSKNTISPLVGLIVCFFGTGSWVAINGLFVELPILVNSAPEGWNLPSYLIVIIQLGNIGPLLYTLGNKMAPHIFEERLVTHVIINMAILSCFLLGFTWEFTSVLGGNEHSTALFVLVFFLALMACTSSVTFIPFMGRFKPGYIVAFFVGQGVSGLLPSVTALIQGVGASSVKCPSSAEKPNLGLTPPQPSLNTTSGRNSSKVLPLSIVPEKPLFSASAFFFFIFGVLCLCEICFLLLNYLPKAKREWIVHKERDHNSKPVKDEQKPLEHHTRNNSETANEPSELFELELTTVDKDSQSSLVSDTVYTETVEDTNDSPTLSMRSMLFVLLIQVYLNAVFNGVIPSVLSYACLPYGEKTYHLALALSAIANPVASLLFYVVALNSVKFMALWTVVYSCLCAYVVGIAAESPCPILLDNVGGSFLIVSCSYLRVVGILALLLYLSLMYVCRYTYAGLSMRHTGSCTTMQACVHLNSCT